MPRDAYSMGESPKHFLPPIFIYALHSHADYNVIYNARINMKTSAISSSLSIAKNRFRVSTTQTIFDFNAEALFA